MIEKRNASATLLLVCCWLMLVGFALLILYPLLQTLLISFKSSAEFTRDPTGFPAQFRWANYGDAWVKGKMNNLFLNSIIVTAGTIVLTILLASPAGFALAKLLPRRSNVFYNYFILGLIVPFQVIMIPLLKILRPIHLINNLPSLITIFTGMSLAFAIIIYTGFYKGLPHEIIEATQLDGCNTLQLFTKIIFPLTGSVNATVAIVTGIAPWSQFLPPLIFCSDERFRTLPIGILKFSSAYYTDWTIVFAAVIMQAIPIVVLFLLMQKTFIKGITEGSIKG